MSKSSTLNLGTGAFVLLGFAALAFLTTQTTSRGLALRQPAALRRDGEIRQHRRPEGRRAGVDGRGRDRARVATSTSIRRNTRRSCLCASTPRYNQIPTDSDASIYTQGLLGGKFIGLTAGGADTYLKDKE